MESQTLRNSAWNLIRTVYLRYIQVKYCNNFGRNIFQDLTKCLLDSCLSISIGAMCRACILFIGAITLVYLFKVILTFRFSFFFQQFSLEKLFSLCRLPPSIALKRFCNPHLFELQTLISHPHLFFCRSKEYGLR